MADGVVQVPDLVRRRVAHPGAAGRDWLSGLPDLIADLERRWSITVGQPLAGGTASYVARADTADGAAALLKLSVPDPEFADQVRTIQRANGRGYVRLLAHDIGRRAILLEALGPSMDHLGLPPEGQLAALPDAPAG